MEEYQLYIKVIFWRTLKIKGKQRRLLILSRFPFFSVLKQSEKTQFLSEQDNKASWIHSNFKMWWLGFHDKQKWAFPSFFFLFIVKKKISFAFLLRDAFSTHVLRNNSSDKERP